MIWWEINGECYPADKDSQHLLDMSTEDGLKDLSFLLDPPSQIISKPLEYQPEQLHNIPPVYKSNQELLLTNPSYVFQWILVILVAISLIIRLYQKRWNKYTLLWKTPSSVIY